MKFSNQNRNRIIALLSMLAAGILIGQIFSTAERLSLIHIYHFVFITERIFQCLTVFLFCIYNIYSDAGAAGAWLYNDREGKSQRFQGAVTAFFIQADSGRCVHTGFHKNLFGESFIHGNSTSKRVKMCIRDSNNACKIVCHVCSYVQTSKTRSGNPRVRLLYDSSAVERDQKNLEYRNSFRN